VITFLFLALVVVIVFVVLHCTNGDPVNVFKGVFIHKRYDNIHYPVARYSGVLVSGVCVKGYRCHKCGYRWTTTGGSKND
jgi:hypothetical protein